MSTSPVVDLSNTFGATFIGLVFCLVLFGLALAQTWMYFWHCWNKDTKALKFFITFIIFLETAQTVTVVYTLYWYLVLNFSNVEALAANKWFLTVQANFGSIYIISIQWYYARQIYLVSKKIFPAIIIVTLTIVGSAVGFYGMAIILAAGNITNRFGHVEWLIALEMFECALVDVLITGFMSWALYHNKTGFAKTVSIIKTLMAYTINTGLLTSFLGVVIPVALLISPRSLIPLAFYYPMGTCYVNSLLAMLNSREYIRDRASPENSDSSFTLSSIRVAPSREAFGSQSKQTDISVIVRRSTASTHTRFDPNMGHAFECPKLDTSVTSQCQSRISASNT